ncbi:MAG: hypothetical protein PHR49_03025 [Methanoculleus sp.]|nr:hypothetical protein [Methanoculleus sp.]
MEGTREAVNHLTEHLHGKRPPHRAVIAGLNLLCISLIWFLPGSLAPELFGGGNTHPVFVFGYGGVYLFAAVLFGCSTALLFMLVRETRGGAGVRVFTLPALAVALFLLYMIPAYLGGSMQMGLPFYVPGWEHFGVSPAVDVLMSAVISLSGISLLSLATIAPILLIDRYVTIKRPYVACGALGTLLFPYLTAAIFAIDSVPSLIPLLSLPLSTISVFCLGVAGAVALSIPPVVHHLLKGSGRPPRQAHVLGLFLLCILLVWFVPGYLEPGLFVAGHDYPDPGQKMNWFVPHGMWGSERAGSDVHTVEGTYLIDENASPTGPLSLPALSGTETCRTYTREETGERYIVDQRWYRDEWTFRNEKRTLFEALADHGETLEATLDLGDHLLAAGFERSDAERGYPAWLFVNETARGYILTYERPFDDGRSNDFFIVYYGTYGEAMGPDPDRSLKALIAQRLSPSAIRAPGEGLDEDIKVSRMPDAEPLLYISRTIVYAGTILLTPLLFGCSAALLFAGAQTELEARRRRSTVAVLLSAAALLLLSLIPVCLTGSTQVVFPPFYVPGWDYFGVSSLPDALPSLMVFLPALTLIGLGVIAPYLLLGRRLPLKRPVRAVLVSGTLIFGILIFPLQTMHFLWQEPYPPLAPWFSLLARMVLGFCFVAAVAAAVYAVMAVAGRRD